MVLAADTTCRGKLCPEEGRQQPSEATGQDPVPTEAPRTRGNYEDLMISHLTARGAGCSVTVRDSLAEEKRSLKKKYTTE